MPARNNIHGIKVLLNSALADERARGVELAFDKLTEGQDDSSAPEIFELLVEAVRGNPDQDFRNLIQFRLRLLAEGGNPLANSALADVSQIMAEPIKPAVVETTSLVAKATSAYYEADYESASKLIDAALTIDPDHAGARELEDKIRRRLQEGEVSSLSRSIPTDARRSFRLAGSYLRAGVLLEAKRLVTEAIKLAREAGQQFPEAERLLVDINWQLTGSSSEFGESIPPDIRGLLAEADTAYYAEEYEKAIRLYDQVLALDSGNTRAAEQREKARLTLLSRLQPPDTRIPAEARSRYRRARSYIAAGDYASAEAALKEAIRIAEQAGIDYEEARATLESLEDRIVATEFKTKGDQAAASGQWSEAINQYGFALKLDPEDGLTQGKKNGLESLLRADAILDSLRTNPAGSDALLDELTEIDKTMHDIVMQSDHSILHGLAQVVAGKLQPLREQLAQRQIARGEAWLTQAGEADALARKQELYRKAVQAFDNARLSIPDITIARENEAHNRLEQVSKALTDIAKTRQADNYPHNLDRKRVDEWMALGRLDPTVQGVSNDYGRGQLGKAANVMDDSGPLELPGAAVAALAEAEAFLGHGNPDITEVRRRVEQRQEAIVRENRRRQLYRNIAMGVGGVILLALLFLAGRAGYRSYQLSLTPTVTPTPTATPTATYTPTPSLTPSPSLTPTPSITPTPSLTPSPTVTGTPTPTPLPLGVLTRGVYLYDSPEGAVLGSVGAGELVSIVEIRVVDGDAWHLIRWTQNNLVRNGWVRNAVNPVSTPSAPTD